MPFFERVAGDRFDAEPGSIGEDLDFARTQPDPITQ